MCTRIVFCPCLFSRVVLLIVYLSIYQSINQSINMGDHLNAGEAGAAMLPLHKVKLVRASPDVSQMVAGNCLAASFHPVPSHPHFTDLHVVQFHSPHRLCHVAVLPTPDALIDVLNSVAVCKAVLFLDPPPVIRRAIGAWLHVSPSSAWGLWTPKLFRPLIWPSFDGVSMLRPVASVAAFRWWRRSLGWVRIRRISRRPSTWRWIWSSCSVIVLLSKLGSPSCCRQLQG